MEDDSTKHSYAVLLEEYERWKLRLDTLNIQSGTVVGLRTDHSVFAIAVLLALCAKGAIAALIPRDRSTARYLEDACAAAYLELSVEGKYEWSSLSRPPSHPLINQLSAAGHGGFIIFTSGSTGRPKAALLSIEKFLNKFSGRGRPFRTLAFLMFDHIAGLDTTFYTLAAGGTLILTRHREPQGILRLISSQRVEVLPTTPSFLRMLCASEHHIGSHLSSLRIITYGSEPMDASTISRLKHLLPLVEIQQKYGSTEMGAMRSQSRSEDSRWLKIKPGSVETRVIDGILWIRNAHGFLGYLNAPSPFDNDGWYCTGDSVEVDGEWMRFRGRKTDCISVGGEKVSPIEIEDVILQMDFVRDAIVAGKAHALMGQVVTARVELKSVEVDHKEAILLIRRHCLEKLASYKVPVHIEIVSTLPLSQRHKALRPPL